MDYEKALKLLQSYGQEHVLHYYDKLKLPQQEELLSSIDKIDFNLFKSLEKGDRKLGELTPAETLTLKQIKKQRASFELAGSAAIRSGKVACVLLAGGQGTRLGSDQPKGCYNIGVTRTLSIFECQINNLKAGCKKAGVYVHLFIMTSEGNDAVTREFFEENNYFGYDSKKIHFYKQSLAPAISFDGKILMEERYRPVLTPNGNGGWFASLMKAGYGRLLTKEGIEWLNVFGVDNVLQKPCDLQFLGATLLSGAACGSKVVKKISPSENVGILCKEDGAASIVEYFEMPERLKKRREVNGELTFGYGVILNYLFNVEKLRDVNKKKLPYHLAKKKIPCLKGMRHFVPEEPNGYKIETLAVDIVKLMGSCIGFEVEREKEFAPVKNKTGADSVESARKLLIRNGYKL